MKRCVVSVRGQGVRHGVAAASLQDFHEKVVSLLNLDPTKGPSTLVLAEDGTIVEDEDYFLCLPEDTEFIVLTGDKKWSSCAVDGGTAWLARESVEVDDADGVQLPRWKALAAQLRENLSHIILFSEADFQTLIDVPAAELSAEMAVTPLKAEMLKDTLQGLLDRREEERRCQELLQLYVQAAERAETGVTGERAETGVTGERAETDGTGPAGGDEADSAKNRPSRLPESVLTLLREKSLPHLSLSNEQLQAVCAQDPEALSVDLRWTLENVRQLQTSCAEQLQTRREQIQCMNALSGASQSKRKNRP